jgi:glycosyltransferase involved in cell wall biosynthesis
MEVPKGCLVVGYYLFVETSFSIDERVPYGGLENKTYKIDLLSYDIDVMMAPPTIIPGPTGSDRPKWSVMIPVYNCAHFLKLTLASVLQQDPGPGHMHIEVVDDASTDANIRDIVESLGKGRVEYYRQSENVGSLKNFETCLNRSRGHWVHLLHGDDLVRKGYYQKIESLFATNPQAGAAFTSYIYIDENNRQINHQDPESEADGILNNWLVRIAEKQRIQYCAITVKREVYEKLGGFYGVSYGEDWEMWARIAKQYPVAYSPMVLAEYRFRPGSITGQAFLDGKNIQNLRWVMDIINQYLPERERKRSRKKANRFYSHYALNVANRLWHVLHSRKQVKAQVREAVRLHVDINLLWKISKLYAKMIMNIK